MTVCSVAPKVTTVHVDYTSVINTVDLNTTVADQDAPTGVFAMGRLGRLFSIAQALDQNLVGEHLMEMALSSESGTGDLPVLPILEAYIKGVIEYSGTMFRGCFASNATLHDPRLNIIRQIEGTMLTETIGWTYVSEATRWVLIPGNLITMATISIVVVALCRHAGDIPRESDQFDPSNPLHLVVAAAAGGLSNTFKGLSGNELMESEELDVVLVSIPGRGPALVRADQYAPVSSAGFSPRSGYIDAVDWENNAGS